MIHSLHNVGNDEKHQKERASFLYSQGDFLHVLIDSDPRHVRRSNSLPARKVPITSISDLEIFVLTVNTHLK